MQRFLETMARRPCACLLCNPYCWVQWALWRSNAHPGKSASWLFKKKLIWPVLSFEGPTLLFKLLFASQLQKPESRTSSTGLGYPINERFPWLGFLKPSVQKPCFFWLNALLVDFLLAESYRYQMNMVINWMHRHWHLLTWSPQATCRVEIEKAESLHESQFYLFRF